MFMQYLLESGFRITRLLFMYLYFGSISLLFDIQHLIKSITFSFVNFKRTHLSWLRLPNISYFGKLKPSASKTFSSALKAASDFHQSIISYCWEALLNEVKKSGFSFIHRMELECLHYFKLSVLNHPLQRLRLIDLILCTTPVRFDVALFLIKKGAHFDNSLDSEILFQSAEFFYRGVHFNVPKVNKRGKFYYSNIIYFLAEALRNLALDKNNTKLYEEAKRQFKAILDYICTLSPGANYQMENGVPLIAYMPDEECVSYLLAKGADPNLTNHKFNSLNVAETLLCFEEFERLDILLAKGYSIRNLFNLVAKQRSLNITCYCLLHPALCAQLSEVEKAKLLAANFYQSRREFENQYSGNQFRSYYILSEYKLANSNVLEKRVGELLKSSILELARKSKDAFKILESRNILYLLAKTYIDFSEANLAHKECQKIRDHWVQQQENILDAISELELWECLPEGIAPRFDIKDLNERRIDTIQLEFNARKILGVEPDDPPAAITHAYKKLAVKYHPDKNQSEHAAAEMSCLTKARDILIPRR